MERVGEQGQGGVTRFEPETFEGVVIRAWNLMGGEIRWSALETVAAMLGVSDMEALILGLEQLREHEQRLQKLASEQGT